MKLIGFLTTFAVATLLRAYVTVTLWAWFIVPEFHVAPISKPMGYGIGLLAHMFVGSNTASEVKEELKKSAEEIALQNAFTAFTIPIFCLLLGWLAHRLM